MICADSEPNSLENARKWRDEIQKVERFAPISLVLTRGDLDNSTDVNDLASRLGMQFRAQTSAKENDDKNVERAFEMILAAGYDYKYKYDLIHAPT